MKVMSIINENIHWYEINILGYKNKNKCICIFSFITKKAFKILSFTIINNLL